MEEGLLQSPVSCYLPVTSWMALLSLASAIGAGLDHLVLHWLDSVSKWLKEGFVHILEMEATSIPRISVWPSGPQPTQQAQSIVTWKSYRPFYLLLPFKGRLPYLIQRGFSRDYNRLKTTLFYPPRATEPRSELSQVSQALPVNNTFGEVIFSQTSEHPAYSHFQQNRLQRLVKLRDRCQTMKS